MKTKVKSVKPAELPVDPIYGTLGTPGYGTPEYAQYVVVRDAQVATERAKHELEDATEARHAAELRVKAALKAVDFAVAYEVKQRELAREMSVLA